MEKKKNRNIGALFHKIFTVFGTGAQPEVDIIEIKMAHVTRRAVSMADRYNGCLFFCLNILAFLWGRHCIVGAKLLCNV